MAQKVTGYVKLQIPAGRQRRRPLLAPALGQHGINIAAFTKEFNERTKNDVGLIIPVVITVYADRSFTFITKTPPPRSSSRRPATLRRGPVCLTRIRLPPSARKTSARLPRPRCVT